MKGASCAGKAAWGECLGDTTLGLGVLGCPIDVRRPQDSRVLGFSPEEAMAHAFVKVGESRK